MTTESFARTQGSALYFGGNPDDGFTLEGKLDEVAVFNRALSAADIARQYQASGPDQHLALTARLPGSGTAPVAPAPAFSEKYNEVLRAMKPSVHWPLREPGSSFRPGRASITNASAPTANYSISIWFRNDLANDARPVTGYFFSPVRHAIRRRPGTISVLAAIIGRDTKDACFFTTATRAGKPSLAAPFSPPARGIMSY